MKAFVIVALLCLTSFLHGQSGKYPFYCGLPESELNSNVDLSKFKTVVTELGVKCYVNDGIERGESLSQTLLIDPKAKTVFSYILDFATDEFGELALNEFLKTIVETSVEISQTEWRLYKYGKTVNIRLENENHEKWSLIFILAN